MTEEPDLVDYLKSKLDACTCSDYVVGRREIGYFVIKDWREGCPEHPVNPYEEENRRRFDEINAANVRAYAREKSLFTREGRKWWKLGSGSK